MHRNPISNWQYTFISCQKGRQIILKSICLLKFCGKSNNNTRDGSSSGSHHTAFCGSISPSAFRLTRAQGSISVSNCSFGSMPWLGLAWLKALNTNRGTFQCGCAPLDSIAHEQRKVMLRFMHETWRAADTLPLPAAEVLLGKERVRDGRLNCCTARKVIGCSCRLTFVQSKQLLIGECWV